MTQIISKVTSRENYIIQVRHNSNQIIYAGGKGEYQRRGLGKMLLRDYIQDKVQEYKFTSVRDARGVLNLLLGLGYTIPYKDPKTYAYNIKL